MSSPLPHDEHRRRHPNRAVTTLIAINVAILILQWTVVSDADAFAVLGFRDGSLPRTLTSAITYSFAHFGVEHLALNMFALFMFGPRLEAAMGTRAFILFYLWCGVGGAVAYALFVPSGVLVGASAAVLGVMYGYAHHWPNDETALFGFLPMRVWTMIVLLTTANLVLGVASSAGMQGSQTGVAYLAHLGGFVFAWLYMRTPSGTSIERLRQRISPAPDYNSDEPPRAIPRTLPRTRAQRDEVDEIVAKSKAVAAPKRPVPRGLTSPGQSPGELRAAEVNRVLDKISLEGLDSLTRDERTVLDETAKRLRGEG